MHHDPEDMRTPAPQTEDSAERGYVPNDPQTQDPVTYKDLGQPQHLEKDIVDDIADEGRGHRG